MPQRNFLEKENKILEKNFHRRNFVIIGKNREKTAIISK